MAQATGRLVCFDSSEGPLSEVALGPIAELSGTPDDMCAVSKNGSVFCGRIDGRVPYVTVGTALPTSRRGDGFDPTCSVDPLSTDVPAYPGAPFQKVTAHYFPSAATCLGVSLDGEEPECVKTTPHATLSAAQARRLLRAVNNANSYTALSTCSEPHHEFVFRDADDKPVAVLWFDFECMAAEAEPLVPVHRNTGIGNVVQQPLAGVAVELCLSLRLPACVPRGPR